MSKVIGSFKTVSDATNLTELFDKMQIAVVGRDDGHESDQVSSGSEDESGDEELRQMYDDNVVSQKHLKHSELEERAAEDMDFPDEVDTPFTDARVRFQKYRAVKNLKHADWDPYENLPEAYSKIWRFQNYQAA
jgi:pre-rRNA-processing protein TSR1